MSELERNKGTLVYIGTVADYVGDMDSDQFYDWMEDKGIVQISKKLFTVSFEVESDTECTFFREVEFDDHGVIHFHTMHYNGGGSLEEVLTPAINKIMGEEP